MAVTRTRLPADRTRRFPYMTDIERKQYASERRNELLPKIKAARRSARWSPAEPSALLGEHEACLTCFGAGTEQYWFVDEEMYGAKSPPVVGVRPCVDCERGVAVFESWLTPPKFIQAGGERTPTGGFVYSDLSDEQIIRIYLRNGPSPHEQAGTGRSLQ